MCSLRTEVKQPTDEGRLLLCHNSIFQRNDFLLRENLDRITRFSFLLQPLTCCEDKTQLQAFCALEQKSLIIWLYQQNMSSEADKVLFCDCCFTSLCTLMITNCWWLRQVHIDIINSNTCNNSPIPEYISILHHFLRSFTLHIFTDRLEIVPSILLVCFDELIKISLVPGCETLRKIW